MDELAACSRQLWATTWLSGFRCIYGPSQTKTHGLGEWRGLSCREALPTALGHPRQLHAVPAGVAAGRLVY